MFLNNYLISNLNFLYETFLTEIKKLDSTKIGYEHLCIFEYIIKVEIAKYNLYLETIDKIEYNKIINNNQKDSAKIILTMNQRIETCLKKISFSLGYLIKNYYQHSNIIELCKDLIIEANLENKINIDIINEINSFNELNNKKK
jgi:hypothetical protein